MKMRTVVRTPPPEEWPPILYDDSIANPGTVRGEGCWAPTLFQNGRRRIGQNQRLAIGGFRAMRA